MNQPAAKNQKLFLVKAYNKWGFVNKNANMKRFDNIEVASYNSMFYMAI